MAEEHSIRKISVLNIMNPSRSKDANLSMSQLEKLLKDWIEEGYFYEQNGHVYLGVRSVAEFGEFLRSKFNVDSCHLCKSILLKVESSATLSAETRTHHFLLNFRGLNATAILAMVVSTQAAFGSTCRKMPNVQCAKKFGALQYRNANKLNFKEICGVVM